MKKYSIYLLLWILILCEAVKRDMLINTGSANAYHFSRTVSDNIHELQNTNSDNRRQCEEMSGSSGGVVW
jgi:hypothetical protein